LLQAGSRPKMAVSGEGVSDATAEADEKALALAVLPSL
jgi:hypothetical protein